MNHNDGSADPLSRHVIDVAIGVLMDFAAAQNGRRLMRSPLP